MASRKLLLILFMVFFIKVLVLVLVWQFSWEPFNIFCTGLCKYRI